MIIVGGTGGMPPEPPQKNTLKVKIPFASIKAKPICLRNPEALFSTLHQWWYYALNFSAKTKRDSNGLWAKRLADIRA